MKYIHLVTTNGKERKITPDRIACNNVILPVERSNPHNVRLHLIGNEYGPLGAVWAEHAQEALDELIDADLGKAFLVSEDYLAKLTEAEKEELSYCGNASEACDLQHAWVDKIDLRESLPLQAAFALAEKLGADLLSEIDCEKLGLLRE